MTFKTVPILFGMILIPLLLFADSTGRKTVAVLYFENNSIAQRSDLEPLRKGLADMFTTELSKIDGLKVIERSRLQQMLEEMSLGMSGAVDPKTAQSVGKVLGAQILVFGSYMNMFGGKMRIDARLVETETGLTLEAEEMTGKVDKLFDMVKKLTQKIAKALQVKLTSADKQRLNNLKNVKFEAAVLYSRGLDLEDAGQLKEAAKMYLKAVKTDSGFQLAKDRLNLLTQKIKKGN